MLTQKLKLTMLAMAAIFMVGSSATASGAGQIRGSGAIESQRFLDPYEEEQGASRITRVQNDDRYDNEYDRRGEYNVRIDRYLDIEVWTDRSDGEYYVGDNVAIKFRANQDAFVAIYSIDSRDRVSLIFPSGPSEDNYVRGGITYRIPDGRADFDLIVNGPEGVENIQIIASRERFPVPDWYGISGIVNDWEDRHEFMDYLNSRHFARYDGQRFAYDRTAIYINEWEPTYFRPVYYPSYPSWTVSGNIYLDYPWGTTVYIDGIYWGVTPLYIPRLYVGWHTFTVCDYRGYYWESDIHVNRYNTVVLDRHVIDPRPNVRTKYKEIRRVGYRDPVKFGYPNYSKRVTTMKTTNSKITTRKSVKKANTRDSYVSPTKRYVRGEGKVVKTERGYESAGGSVSKKRVRSTDSGRSVYKKSRSGSSTDNQAGRVQKRSKSSEGSSTSRRTVKSQGSNKGNSKVIKKSTASGKSGSSSKARTVKKQTKSKPKASGTKSSGSKIKAKKSGSSGKSTSVKKSSPSKGSSKKTSKKTKKP